MIESTIVKLFIALLLGAAIGLERQSSAHKKMQDLTAGGLRTFALVSLLGGIAGIFYANNMSLVFAFMAAGFVALLTSHYIIASRRTDDFGLTTEVSFVLTFLIGVAITTTVIPLQIIVAIAVVMILILSLKAKSTEFVSEVSRHELESFISYAIIALVILPFLPNIAYTLSDLPLVQSLLSQMNIDPTRFMDLELLNPRKMWFIVVLVTGIDMIGYVLSKFVGAKRGFTLTSFIGGFISSTSTTQSLAQRSNKVKISDYLVGAAVLANMASFFQIFLLVGPLNTKWLVFILPTLAAIIIVAGMVAYYFLRKPHSEKEIADKDGKQIFSLIPALKFAVLLITVKIVTGLCLILFGESGFLISSIIASFAGLDAILVNLATMAGSTVSFQFALLTLILVNATNLLSKAFYSFLQGTKPFAAKFLVSALLIIIASCIGWTMM